MSRNTKIILGILSGVVVVCICSIAALFAMGAVASSRLAGYVEENMSDDPAQVEAAAVEVAGFDLPSGYQPEFTMDIVGMKMVGFARDNASIIMFMQLPTYMQANPEQMQQQMEQAMRSQFNTRGGESRVVDQIETEINGQPATLTISETTGGGDPQRQLYTMFRGSSGLVMLMIVGPASTWDQDEIDAFLGSIR